MDCINYEHNFEIIKTNNNYLCFVCLKCYKCEFVLKNDYQEFNCNCLEEYDLRYDIIKNIMYCIKCKKIFD